MDFEENYNFGDVGNIGAQGRTREEIRRHAQAMETALEKMQDTYEGVARESEETNKLIRRQMKEQADEKYRQALQEAKLKSYRKQLASLKTALVDVKRAYGVS